MSSLDLNDLKVQNSLCSKCGESGHYIISENSINLGRSEGADPYSLEGQYAFGIEYVYTTLKCCGCGTMSYCESLWNSGERENIYCYPPPILRKPPIWFDSLPEELKPLLKEIYLALQYKAFQLAMMGIRAILDLFMIDKLGKDSECFTFQQKLKMLVSQGFIFNGDINLLNVALDAGHASIHRGYCHSFDEINQALNIVEHVFERDILESSLPSIKKSIPPKKHK